MGIWIKWFKKSVNIAGAWNLRPRVSAAATRVALQSERVSHAGRHVRPDERAQIPVFDPRAADLPSDRLAAGA